MDGVGAVDILHGLGIRQFLECLHLPFAAGHECGAAAFGLSKMPCHNRRIGQHPGTQLVFAARQVPAVQTTDLSAVLDRGVDGRHIVRNLSGDLRHRFLRP